MFHQVSVWGDDLLYLFHSKKDDNTFEIFCQTVICVCSRIKFITKFSYTSHYFLFLKSDSKKKVICLLIQNFSNVLHHIEFKNRCEKSPFCNHHSYVR